MSARSDRFDFWTLVLVIVVGLALGVGDGIATSAEIDYPMPGASDADEAGLFRDKPAPPPRTTPVEPTPTFEPIPPVDNVVPPAGEAGATTDAKDKAATSAALTPEQKEQLKGLLVQAATLLLGAFLGGGHASPFISTLLQKLLAMFAQGQAPPATPARVRAKRKAVKAK